MTEFERPYVPNRTFFTGARVDVNLCCTHRYQNEADRIVAEPNQFAKVSKAPLESCCVNKSVSLRFGREQAT
jgi:hypothetical protein